MDKMDYNVLQLPVTELLGRGTGVEILLMGYRELDVTSQDSAGFVLYTFFSVLWVPEFPFCHGEDLHTCCFSIKNVNQECLYFLNHII